MPISFSKLTTKAKNSTTSTALKRRWPVTQKVFQSIIQHNKSSATTTQLFLTNPRYCCHTANKLNKRKKILNELSYLSIVLDDVQSSNRMLYPTSCQTRWKNAGAKIKKCGPKTEKMRPVKAKYAGFFTTLFSQSVCVIYALFNFYTEYFVFHSSYKCKLDAH
jgi:hypothetical protein